MHRSKLLKLLHDYNPSNDEVKFKNRMIEFIEGDVNCFKRSNAHGHITASAWLLNNAETQALLMHHNKLDKWLQLGGHCDGNNDVISVALKEATEESGSNSIALISDNILDIDIHIIPEYKGVPEHLHYDIRFLCKMTTDELLKGNYESKELKWVDNKLHDLPTREASIIRMYNKWFKLNF